MKTHLFYLFTRTPLHVGAGTSVGAVDQPIQRERHTGYPIIPGSSIKGVLRDHFDVADEGNLVFGKAAGNQKNVDEDNQENSGHAGSLAFSEAKTLLFPVRSARGGYALITSPLALSRYRRDAGLAMGLPDSPQPSHCLAGRAVTLKKGEGVVLEEYAFQHSGEFPQAWAEHFSKLLNDPVLEDAAERLVLLADEDFAHFVLSACQIQQHNKINRETGVVNKGALFNEETVPAETLFYALLTDLSRNDSQRDEVAVAMQALEQELVIQFGGNATTGLGFCGTKLITTNKVS